MGEYALHGCDVRVAVREFAPGEARLVDEATALDTGMLLARRHTFSEQNDCHVAGPALFASFADNDLFFTCGPFSRREQPIPERRSRCARMEAIESLRARPRFAARGDLGGCSLCRRADGAPGALDFNRGGSIPFADAVMQAVSEARFMDYAPDAASGLGERFPAGERARLAHMCACAAAFRDPRVRIEAGDAPGVTALPGGSKATSGESARRPAAGFGARQSPAGPRGRGPGDAIRTAHAGSRGLPEGRGRGKIIERSPTA